MLPVIPAAVARQLTRSPEVMAVTASVIGAIAVVADIAGSVEWDTPTDPSIVTAAALLFAALLLVSPLLERFRQ